VGFSNATVGVGGTGNDRTWTDNFQVGGPGPLALHAPNQISLSSVVLGPGNYPAGTRGLTDGYYNAGTVELIGSVRAASAGATAVTRDGAGPIIDFSAYVSGDGTAGGWGSNVHGRGGNLWLPGDGEADEPHDGFGAHANKFITFDLDEIRAQHLAGAMEALRLTARFGVNGIVGGQNPPFAVVQGGVWMDGELLDLSGLLSRMDPSYEFDLRLPDDGRYLTLAILNGNASTAWDDGAFRDVTLTVIPEPATMALLGLGLGLAALARRRRRE